ncbi:MAG: LamG-like jellyroll fold domain-containing protein [Elusimicrobiota bacterium]
MLEMSSIISKARTIILITLISSISQVNPAVISIGKDNNNWDSKVAYENTVKVQATGKIEIKQLVDDYHSYWRFDNNTLLDENVTNQNDGIGLALIYNASGKYGGAYSFDGQKSYINCGKKANLNITEAITVEAWINPLSDGGWFTSIVQKLYWDGWIGFALFHRVDKIYFVSHGESNGPSYSISSSYGKWIHLAGQYDGAKLRLFINGEEKGTAVNLSGGLGSSSAQELNIGRRAASFFDGQIDDVRLYNRALSLAEIKQTMNNEHYLTGRLVSVTEDAEFSGLTGDVWKQITVDALMPAGTSIDLHVRTSFDNDIANSQTAWTLIQANAGSGITYNLPLKERKRYLQWKLELKTNDASLTPEIQNIILSGENIPDKIKNKNISIGPNPFTPARPSYDKVYFNIDQPAETIMLEIYSSKGRLIFEKDFNSAENIYWDGRNNSGEIAEDGGYLYQLKIDGKTYNGTVILAR